MELNGNLGKLTLKFEQPESHQHLHCWTSGKSCKIEQKSKQYSNQPQILTLWSSPASSTHHCKNNANIALHLRHKLQNYFFIYGVVKVENIAGLRHIYLHSDSTSPVTVNMLQFWRCHLPVKSFFVTLKLPFHLLHFVLQNIGSIASVIGEITGR